MATYFKPKVLEDVFNLQNFIDAQNNTTSFLNYAQLTISNTFQTINTFLSDVFINGNLYVTNLNISNTFLGYNISMFDGLKAPIQAQFDSITTGGNVTIQSTVSVADTLTVSYGTPASVQNIGTNINANLKFSVPQGAPAVQPSFKIGDVKTNSIPTVTLTGTTTEPILNFGLVSGNDGVTPSFSIGNVTSQSTPSVSLSGTAPNYKFNFGLEKGDVGAPGKDAVNPSFSIGTVTTTTNPSVSLSGTSPNYQLNFGLQRGETGQIGNTPTFSIGSVSTSDSNSSVTISNTDILNPILNFTLQKGDKGDAGKDGNNGRNGSNGKDADTSALAAATATAVSSAGIAGTAATAAAFSAGVASDAAIAAGLSAGAARESADEVNAKLYYFTADLVTQTERCGATLNIASSNPLQGNIIKLSNSGQSEFGYNVRFDENIIAKGNILNFGDNNLNILSTNGGDLNLTANSVDSNININTNTLYLNASQNVSINTALKTNNIQPVEELGNSLTINHNNVIIPNTLKTDSINSATVPPITVPPTQTSLTIAHDNVIVSNKLKVNEMTCTTISEIYDRNGNPSNLTITHPKIKINNKLCVDEINSVTVPPITVPPTETSLDILHDNVIISHNLKIDKISSILPSELNAQRTLTITHDNVAIPVNLKTDRISSVTVPLITVPPTETSLTLSHDNVIVSNKLKSNNITSSDTNLNVVTTFWNPALTGTGNTVGNGGVINIGNKDHPNECTIFLYGRVVHLVNTPDDGVFPEIDGFINQLGL